MTTIMVRWGAGADATVNSVYRIERCLDGVTWETLDDALGANLLLAAATGELAANTDAGAAVVGLVDAAAFGTNGYAWLDDALVRWTGKSGNNLTGVMWLSGYGTHAAGSRLVVANESLMDTDVTIAQGAVLYRITHFIVDVGESAPALLWHFAPPAPCDSHHCTVVVFAGTDVGGNFRSDVVVRCWLEHDDEFNAITGEYLDSDEDAANKQVTNAFGLAFFDCVQSSKRMRAGGQLIGSYLFQIDNGVPFRVAIIPDRDWIVLAQLVE